MSTDFKRHKRLFRLRLQPVFAMLKAKRNTMDTDAWRALVSETIEDILQNPSEYLGTDLPSPSLISDILTEIGHEFLRDMKRSALATAESRRE